MVKTVLGTIQVGRRGGLMRCRTCRGMRFFTFYLRIYCEDAVLSLSLMKL